MSAQEKLLIKPKKLTSELFKKFGDVIEVSEQSENFAINDGFTQRYHDLANVDVNENNGRTLINIFRSVPLSNPIVLESMERHPLSSQAFMPLGHKPYLVVVAPSGDLVESAIEVFLSSANQGVNYSAGTWHHYCLALSRTSDFLVIDRGGEGDNCDEILLSRPIEIDLSEMRI